MRIRSNSFLSGCRPLERSRQEHKTKKLEYQWEAWKAEGSMDEKRGVAVDRMRDCLNDPSGISLDLHDLGLKSLPPELPPCEHLDLSKNQLIQLIKKLPEELKSINAGYNPLQELPDSLPGSIEKIEIPSCQLTYLPERLPRELKEINADSNQIIRLPEKWPSKIKIISLKKNRLTKLNTKFSHSTEHLNFENNQLTLLTEAWPSALKKLNLSKNKLEKMPSKLPDISGNKMDLDVSNNLIKKISLCLPKSLYSLNADFNDISDIPYESCKRLDTLSLRSNQISDLSELIISDSLRTFDLRDNQLMIVPPLKVPKGNKNICTLYLGGNAFDFMSLEGLQDFINNEASQYNLRINMETTGKNKLKLENIVSNCFPPAKKKQVVSRWKEFRGETNSDAFTNFLSTLTQMQAVKELPEFYSAIANWLEKLAESQSLRKKSFIIAYGSTETCDDGVIYTYNKMQKVLLEHEVQKGHFDKNLPLLIDNCRALFRLEQLDLLAKEKTEELRVLDPLEVNLTWQVELRIKLDLHLVSPAMHYRGDPRLTDKNSLEAVERCVKERENQQFPKWLSESEPWIKAIRRLDPQGFEQARNEHYNLLEDPSIIDRRIKTFKRDGMQIAPAGNIYKTITDDIAWQINKPLLINFLTKHNATDLLNKRWKDEELPGDPVINISELRLV